ncbi:hypothetical protein YC2023_016058 [Brassica napus]
MNARLGDFGLAKLYDQGIDPQTSKVAGEFGGEIELVLKLGVLCSYQAESVRPDMSAVMRILNGVLQLPDNLFDVVRAERLRGQPEISMEVLLAMNSMRTLPFTNSFISHGR